jgi:hypothetical protein
MIESTPSPEFERVMADVLRVPDPPAEFARTLRADWLAGIARRHTPSGRRAPWRWVLAVVILIAVGACTCIAVTATRRGFIPEVGLVEDVSSVRYLAEPASVSREGITLEVVQATADTEKILIKFQGSGLDPSVAHWRGVFPGNGGGTYILLSDGTRIESTVGGMNGEIFGNTWYGYYEEERFPPLPKGVFSFTLVVPHLAPMPEGAGPSDWRIPVKLGATRMAPVPRPFDTEIPSTPVRAFQNGVYPTVTPILFFPTETPIHGPFPVYTVEPQPTRESADGIVIIPEWMAETDEGFVFAGKIQSKTLNFSAMDENRAYLIDSRGTQISLFTSMALDTMGASWNDREYSFRVESTTKDIRFPVRLVIPEIVIWESNSGSPEPELFSLDLGEAPQDGDSWEINRTFEVNGHSIWIESASWGRCSEGGCLRFALEVGPEIYGVTVAPLDPAVSTVFVSWRIQNGRERSDIICGDQPPSGNKQFIIQSLQVNLTGPWSAVYAIAEEE